MSAALERRYAALLRLYPADYRRARGAEVLETLMASAEDGRERPAAREVTALILGALRSHAGRGQRPTVRHSWLAACRAAAVMLLIYGTAGVVVSTATLIAFRLGPGAPGMWSPTAPSTALTLLASALGLYAAWATWRNRYRSAAVAAVTAFLVGQTAAQPMGGPFWQFPLAVALLLPLAKRRPPPVAGLLRYVPVLVPLLLVVTDHGLAQVFPDVAGILRWGIVVALCAGGLLWLVVDERVALALGLLLANSLPIQVYFLFEASPGHLPAAVSSIAFTAFWPALLLVPAALTARRQAQL